MINCIGAKYQIILQQHYNRIKVIWKPKNATEVVLPQDKFSFSELLYLSTLFLIKGSRICMSNELVFGARGWIRFLPRKFYVSGKVTAPRTRLATRFGSEPTVQKAELRKCRTISGRGGEGRREEGRGLNVNRRKERQGGSDTESFFIGESASRMI